MPSVAAHSAFLTAGGEMGARMRRLDWAKTPLGPVETWPQSLRTSISIILSSRYAMFVWWGEQAQEALRQVQKLDAVGQLTGGIAHDFNNLLTVIIGSIERIQNNLAAAGNERLHSAASMAMQGARRAATLTHRLLAFSRMQPLSPQPTDVNRLVGETTDLLHRILGETIELEAVLAPGLWVVDVDRGQLENALVNLAVNARDAMPQGGRLAIETGNAWFDEATIQATPGLKVGHHVLISISDTGCGIPRDIVDRVFEPFFTTKEVGRGTGLGLSQVYGFIKQSGGHVRIDSEPGEGTTVRLYLPRYQGPIPAEWSRSTEADPSSGHGEVILVVEDDDQVRANTAEMLSDLGYRVIEAEDAHSALRMSEAAQRIDLLFTDLVLPGGYSGRQLAEKMLTKRPATKVLYTTGYALSATVHRGDPDPGSQLLAKPYVMNELAARVSALLHG